MKATRVAQAMRPRPQAPIKKSSPSRAIEYHLLSQGEVLVPGDSLVLKGSIMTKTMVIMMVMYDTYLKA